MQIKFDAQQDYQLEAIESIATIFDSQAFIEADLKFTQFGQFSVTSNRLDIVESQLLENVRAVQLNNGLKESDEIGCIQLEIETENGRETIRFPNFSIDMETGTGKTYVYIRSALELARRYGMRKFIIVVPRVAIREGVLKTFQITEAHLKELFSNMPYRYRVYDSGNLSRLKQFAESNVVEFLIMTIDSFNKDANVIRQANRDEMNGIPPIYLIQNTSPILILDEPQLMGSEQSIRALGSLNPLFALRFSATHKRGEEYNVVYRLSPYEAYRRGLVKQVEVAGVERTDDANKPFLRLVDVISVKQKVRARIVVHVLGKSGTVQEKEITVTPDDDLVSKTGLPDYSTYVFDEFRIDEQAIYFDDGKTLRKGDMFGADKDRIFEAQIRYTVEQHFRRQKRLRERGIKVLSLFFIDRVDNYVQSDGIIRQLFNKVFNELKLKQEYAEWVNVDPSEVQGSYFAQRQTRSGEVVYEESKTGESERDKEAYDLILRDKESLLTLPSPSDDPESFRKRQIAFIFSHSALREGWDNPNIFQLCTLNQSVSEMRKRQEIGRGVRLAVDQHGNRVFDKAVNVLTVVANQNYEAYVSQYQSEVEIELGNKNAAPKPLNARTGRIARLRQTKEHFLSDEFKELWERIKYKTRYNVKIDSDKLVRETIADINQVTVAPPRLTVTKARIEIQNEHGNEEFIAVVSGRTQAPILEMRETGNLHTLLDMMLHQLQFTTPPIRLTRKTLLKILSNIDEKQRIAAFGNPQEFASTAVKIMKTRLADQLVDGIIYERIDSWYELSQFAVEIESWDEYLVPAAKSIYDNVVTDNSEPERQFVRDLENWDAVKLFVKLPNWFVVPTPIGNYNPDWAVVIEPVDAFGKVTGEQYTYLVAETKSTLDLNKLRPDERRKILCGSRHFKDALGVIYTHVTQVHQLLDTKGV